MLRISAIYADRLTAQALRGGPFSDQETLRDWLDLRTGSELDYMQLNLLTDMVWTRIKETRK